MLIPARVLSALAFAFALLSGCSDHAVTAPAGRVAASRAAAAAAASRPISGRCETVFTQTPLDPTHAHVIVRGTCRLEHLGRSTVFIDQIADFAASTLTGVTIYTAANGDELRSTGSVQILTPPDAAGNSAFAGPHTFTGGSGRFAHARGGYTFTGRANLVTFTGFFEIAGTITFAASDRRGR